MRRVVLFLACVLGVLMVTGGVASAASCTINDGDSYTNSRSLSVSYFAWGNTQYRISDSSFFGWPDATWYAMGSFSQTSYTLSSSSEGSRTVYMQFRNGGTDLYPDNCSDSIILDTSPPITSPGYVSSSPGKSASISFSASDRWSGVDHTEYQIDYGTWTRYSGSFVVTAPPQTRVTRTISYRSVDKAGNVEATKSLSVYLNNTDPAPDTVGPVCTARNLSVKRGKVCRILFNVHDASSARVTTRLVIMTQSGVVKKQWSWGYYKTSYGWWWTNYRCLLAKGTYRIVVTGEDVSGNSASVVGRARLVVK